MPKGSHQTFVDRRRMQQENAMIAAKYTQGTMPPAAHDKPRMVGIVDSLLKRFFKTRRKAPASRTVYGGR
jgi:hypothetical protein